MDYLLQEFKDIVKKYSNKDELFHNVGKERALIIFDALFENNKELYMIEKDFEDEIFDDEKMCNYLNNFLSKKRKISVVLYGSYDKPKTNFYKTLLYFKSLYPKLVVITDIKESTVKMNLMRILLEVSKSYKIDYLFSEGQYRMGYTLNDETRYKARANFCDLNSTNILKKYFDLMI